MSFCGGGGSLLVGGVHYLIELSLLRLFGKGFRGAAGFFRLSRLTYLHCARTHTHEPQDRFSRYAPIALLQSAWRIFPSGVFRKVLAIDSKRGGRQVEAEVSSARQINLGRGARRCQLDELTHSFLV